MYLLSLNISQYMAKHTDVTVATEELNHNPSFRKTQKDVRGNICVFISFLL